MLLRVELGGPDGTCIRRSVYFALCRIASDEGAESFIASKCLIAYRAGISIRSLQRVFPDLERIGLLRIERNASGDKTPSRYTLLAADDNPGQASTPCPIDIPCLDRKHGHLADRIEEHRRTTKRKAGAEPAVPAASARQKPLAEPSDWLRRIREHRPRCTYDVGQPDEHATWNGLTRARQVVVMEELAKP